ncbi:cytochrome P450 monooxygenase [Fusarium pseudocircinatum]|uniref:Cytochrome P450 monooxygenase n=1 Tax=Fusarium pseudocircinatum TaxID=56676 RepID=A0A8H5P0G4_9HYPO|nr:cytochrome P450 monooxygenase [Fusarium pseudocircinatum]
MAVDTSNYIQGLPSPLHVSVAITVALLTALLWRLYNDPLGHIPGPLVARFTPIWLWWLTWTGVECRVIDRLHKKYGPVVRIAPNEVDVSDGAALSLIYIKNGGYMKSPIYRNYDVNGFETIFSALDPAHRAPRAKAVAPMFAHQRIAKGKPDVDKVLDAFVAEMERRKDEANGVPLDVLNLCRALALDTVTVYLFGECFHGISNDRLRVTEFINNFVAGGRFFYLPGWFYDFVDHWSAKLDKKKLLVAQSTDMIQEYATQVVDRSIVEEKDVEPETFQGRLLAAGISREEAIAQVVDVMFAGTDAAGTTMAILCWNLAQHPEKYDRVYKEVIENTELDAQSLPYLTGVVKESLRLSMANPTRFPRIVPPGGMQVPGLPNIPPGTSVGAGAFMLHHNPEVFPNPRQFMPERWLNPSQEMLRDSFYFGAGSRQCIARNLASAGLWWAAEALIRSDVLRNAKVVRDKIEIVEWFNAKIVGEKIELHW